MSDNTAVVNTSTKENPSNHEAHSKKGSSQGSSTNASAGVQSAELKGSSGNSIRPKPKNIGNYILGKIII